MPRVRPKPSTDLVSEEILKEIKSIRPLRLFIIKQKKKGSLDNPFTLRAKFNKLSRVKQARFLQKSVDQYIELLDERDIDEHVQTEGRLFDILLTKNEQKKYFQSINAPIKPPGRAMPYYTQIIKQENEYDNEIDWDSLNTTEQKSYKKMRKEAKAEYPAQARNFANDLPERLRIDYLLFAEPSPPKCQSNNTSDVNGHDDTSHSAPIRRRRKSLTALPESLQTTSASTSDDIHPKLTRIQLNELHKFMPNVLYYESEVLDDEKPTFTNTTTKNTHIRSVFNQLSEKKRHKFILKSTKKWEEFLQSNPTIIENQSPTLHLLLGKNDDIHYYFSSLGLPPRPPVAALYLYNNERQQTGSQQNWSDLLQTTKDDYIKRLTKLKNEYHQKFLEFVEKTLPSDYVRLEFFRHVKHAAKDYELAIKDRIPNKDDGQLKITQYLTPKKKSTTNNDSNEFDRIKQQLLTTQLTNTQKKLVERLGQLMNKYIEDNKKNSKTESKHQSPDIVIVNGEISSDDDDDQTEKKKKKKRKRDRSEIPNEKEKATKKRK